MRRLLPAGLWSPPALGTRLWLTLAGLVVGALNLALLAEIWPHTPAVRPVLLALEWLLVLALLPQGLWWAWRWLHAYTGPGWLRVLATAVFLSGACGVVALWLAVLVGGPVVWLYESECRFVMSVLEDKHTLRLLPALWWLLVLLLMLRPVWWVRQKLRASMGLSWLRTTAIALLLLATYLVMGFGMIAFLLCLLMAGWD